MSKISAIMYAKYEREKNDNRRYDGSGDNISLRGTRDTSGKHDTNRDNKSN